MSYKTLFSLDNKKVFITGGAGLIGSEITKGVAELGGIPIIIDKNEKLSIKLCKKLSQNGYTCYYENLDLTLLENIDEFIDKLIKKYSTIDGWVNCAYPKTDDWGNNVENLNLSSWRKNIDMHLNSYSWISRKVCLQMKNQGFGSLINFSSIYGLVGNDFTIYEGTNITPDMTYSVIKGGIINLTRFLSSYFGKFNVRVNSICPGGVYNKQDKLFVQNYSNKTPLKRMAKPQEIASACIFLISDASSYITGHTLIVDGGWTAI